MREVSLDATILLDVLAYRLHNEATRSICSGCDKKNAELVRKRGRGTPGSDGDVVPSVDMTSGDGDDQHDVGGVAESGDVGVASRYSHQRVVNLVGMVKELEEELAAAK